MEEARTSTREQQAGPDGGLRRLDRLVGTWRVSGEAQGQVTYRWLDGGYFMIQDVDVEQGGRRNKGIEIVGRERPFGATEPSEDIRSRYYDVDGNTLDYVYELDGDTLTIWGEKGSPAYYMGTFSTTNDTISGAWVWPGGGYSSTMTRVA
jgi:hypothetical protein